MTKKEKEFLKKEIVTEINICSIESVHLLQIKLKWQKTKLAYYQENIPSVEIFKLSQRTSSMLYK